ncbi:MAG: hypothetical protein ABG776_21700 [Cyanobacteria bacterium J06555_13]
MKTLLYFLEGYLRSAGRKTLIIYGYIVAAFFLAYLASVKWGNSEAYVAHIIDLLLLRVASPELWYGMLAFPLAFTLILWPFDEYFRVFAPLFFRILYLVICALGILLMTTTAPDAVPLIPWGEPLPFLVSNTIYWLSVFCLYCLFGRFYLLLIRFLRLPFSSYLVTDSDFFDSVLQRAALRAEIDAQRAKGNYDAVNALQDEIRQTRRR